MPVFGLTLTNGQDVLCDGLTEYESFYNLSGAVTVASQQTASGVQVAFLPVSRMAKYSPNAPHTMFLNITLQKIAVLFSLPEEQLNTELVTHYRALRTGISLASPSNSAFSSKQ